MEYKITRVVFLGKLGKKDVAQANAYRLIAFLPYLGKGLERIYAKALLHQALTTGLVGTQQAGAIPGQSATDLVAALIHNYKAARTKNKYGALVLIDVRGGFNTMQY